MEKNITVALIQWDTGGDRKLLEKLPIEMTVPSEIILESNPKLRLDNTEDEEEILDVISEYITEKTGFCHYGFVVES